MKDILVLVLIFSAQAPSLASLLARNVVTAKISLHNTIDSGTCGLRPTLPDNGTQELNTRVVGGFESIRNSWPSICSLRHSQYPDSHFCGADLIKNLYGDYFMITAAHCVQNNNQSSQYLAFCGVHNVSSRTEPHRIKVEFSNLSIHPFFNHTTLDYDVAIFSISTSVPTNEFISPVCLPYEDMLVGEKAIVVGWGSLRPETPHARVLHQVTVPIMPQETCQSMYTADAVITDRMFCAGLRSGGIDACDGDSGGPLYSYRLNEWNLIGIVSWGYGCADPGYTSVYTDVMVVRDWINRIINYLPDDIIG
nr:serine peptidase 1 [Biomphalaria glabrata]